MLYATTVKTEKELKEIQRLNQQNLKKNLSEEEIVKEGFVSWFYSLELLKNMHQLAPSIIVKEEDEVIAYALVTLKEASTFHNDLRIMIENLQSVIYKNRPLLLYNFYLMGQVCIHKNYRGKGVFSLLYKEHKKVYSADYDLLVTEISTNNKRSLKAHEKVGFEDIHTYQDKLDQWSVVVWDWRNDQTT